MSEDLTLKAKHLEQKERDLLDREKALENRMKSLHSDFETEKAATEEVLKKRG